MALGMLKCKSTLHTWVGLHGVDRKICINSCLLHAFARFTRVKGTLHKIRFHGYLESKLATFAFRKCYT